MAGAATLIKIQLPNTRLHRTCGVPHVILQLPVSWPCSNVHVSGRGLAASRSQAASRTLTHSARAVSVAFPGAHENGNLTVVLHPALQELSFSGHTLPPADATLGLTCFILPRHMRREPVVEPSCLAETYPAAADLLCRCIAS